jgi:aminoglycoside phosphotransferase (APT) family kinase protein
VANLSRRVVSVEPLGSKLAEGRDSEIFEHGSGRVLRRARDGRSLVGEAEVMRYAYEHDYPAPRVFESGEGWLVMERLEGTDLLAGIRKTPRGVIATGKLLADLHRRLGAITAPEWLSAGPGAAGDRMIHLDLHPLNVIGTPNGPVVIDWANVRRGDPATDVANTWSLLACGEVPGGRVDRALATIGRGLLLRSFLASLDRAAAHRAMPALVEWRLRDRNHTDTERQRLRRLVR